MMGVGIGTRRNRKVNIAVSDMTERKILIVAKRRIETPVHLINVIVHFRDAHTDIVDKNRFELVDLFNVIAHRPKFAALCFVLGQYCVLNQTRFKHLGQCRFQTRPIRFQVAPHRFDQHVIRVRLRKRWRLLRRLRGDQPIKVIPHHLECRQCSA